MASNNEELNCHLKHYYSSVFPSNLFFKWLSYKDNELFSKREFSFTLEGDIYLRYQSFENAKEFSDELKKKVPHKIDIGAVYNIKPKLSRTLGGGHMVPIWKELVFDIDMTDYDDVRVCCGDKTTVKICEKCWTVMKVAVRVIDRALRQDFGYKHIMWVYSGRRGVHCWVSDYRARMLTAAVRKDMVEYLTLVRAANNNKRVQLYNDEQWINKYHPSIVKSLKLIKMYFSDFALQDQRLMDNVNGENRLLQMLPKESSELHDKLIIRWENNIDGEYEDRWKELVGHLEQDGHGKVVDEIMIECMYPRLDANVSTGVNHLLKSPFCVHPATGRICVPFRADEVDDFDPFSVPMVQEILAELEKNGDVMSSSLGKYMKVFEDFVENQ